MIELTDEMYNAFRASIAEGNGYWKSLTAVLALVERDQAAIADDVRTVLAQAFHPHVHRQPGIWDREQVPCVDCAARSRLAALFSTDQARRL